MRNWLLNILVVLLIAGCDGKSDDPQPPPFSAVLLLPAQNEACTSGTILSDTESKVLFKWESAKHTDSYELNIKNLLTSTSISHTLADTSKEVTLARNTPYSWYVISKSSKRPDAVKSALWKFYNAGIGPVSYTPFPAEIVSPLMAQNIQFSTGKINLDWNGSDADNDIVSYTVYFGTSKTPALLADNLTVSLINDVPVTANTTYYWKVITKDSKGNASDSGTFEFKIN